MLLAIVLVVLCYLIGAVPFPVLVSRYAMGIDLRQHGSGNMGAMNAARVLGKRWFPAVFGLDFAKGALAAYLAMRVLPLLVPMDTTLAAAIGACAAVIGHCFPVYVGFKGGVGLAASAGALVIISPWLLVAVGLSILLLWLLSRNMYAGTAFAALLTPLYAWLLLHKAGATAAVTVWALVVFAVHFKDVRRWWAERRAA